MQGNKSYLSLFIASLLASGASWGEEVNSTDDALTGEKNLSKIIVTSNPIFDESAPDSFFIHRWANYLHINTRESVILNKLPFSEESRISQKDLEEAQRNLRAEPYIRDAKISFSNKDPQADAPIEGETVLVETWDNWSLLPTVSFSHSGGESEFSIGIKEDNLLGYGIKTRMNYQSDADRTGYKLAFEAPLDNVIKHSKLGVSFYDNSDGQSTKLYFYKPFYTLDTKDSYSITYLEDLRNDTLKQNGMDINEFEVKQDFINLLYGWRISKNDDTRSRLITGLTQDKNQFSHLDSYPNSKLPQDRDFFYPWVAYEFLQDDYTVLNNVHLIHNNEDFNLGWHHYLKLGLELNDTNSSSSPGYHIDWKTTRGYKDEAKLLLLEFDGTAALATSQDDFYRVNASAEYFYQIHPKWTAYAKTRISTSKNNYLDQTFALGDETGIRGYPNDYQHGDNQWSLTTEIRHYPHINLYQLAELGWAAFVDVGQAFGGPDENNEVSGPIGSLGIGARIFSSHSSYGNVAHIDFSVPFTSGEEVNSWEWRFQVKNHF